MKNVAEPKKTNNTPDPSNLQLEKVVAVTSAPKTTPPKIDITRAALPQSFELLVETEKHVTEVPVRKPKKQEFIRTHDDVGWTFHAWTLTWEDDGRVYLVDPDVRQALGIEAVPTALIAASSKTAGFFVWPIRLPDPDGKHNPWHRSALDAATIAKESWVRVTSNRSAGCYDTLVAKSDYGEPEWPSKTFEELLQVAFQDAFISDLEHPIAKKLRGEE